MYLFTDAHGCNISSRTVKRWNCIPGGMYPMEQAPPLCSNRFTPSHFKVTNHSGFFMTLQPSSVFETRHGVQLEKYRFMVERFECDPVPSFSVDIIVFPLQESTPTTAYHTAPLVLVVCLPLLYLLVVKRCISF